MFAVSIELPNPSDLLRREGTNARKAEKWTVHGFPDEAIPRSKQPEKLELWPGGRHAGRADLDDLSPSRATSSRADDIERTTY
jgi:hypothetical protein